jgi:hypothetical protein
MNTIRKTITSTIPPTESNVIWIDISGTKAIQKVFINGEWRPLEDSNVEAEFATGEKVSDISLVKTSGTSADNSKIATVAKLNVTLSGYHERAPYKEAASSSGIATIHYNEATNCNWIPDNNTTTIILVKESRTTDTVTTIRFTSGSPAITLSYTEADLKWAGDEVPEIEANAEYIIAIWNNIGVISKIDTIE